MAGLHRQRGLRGGGEPCGGVTSGVYAIDLADKANTVRSWTPKVHASLGALGLRSAPTACLRRDRCVHCEPTFAHAVVALAPGSLERRLVHGRGAVHPRRSCSRRVRHADRAVQRRRQRLRARRGLARRCGPQNAAAEVSAGVAVARRQRGRDCHLETAATDDRRGDWRNAAFRLSATAAARAA